MKPIGIVILICTFYITIVRGCMPQVCRKRRNVFDGSVSLQLRGCSGSSPSWVRQVASCLSMNSAQMALEIKSWYSQQYDKCIDRGCKTVKDGATDRVATKQCLDCWIKDLNGASFLEGSHVTVSDITDCVNKYLYSFLSNELPTLETSSAHKGTIRIPESRPSDNWWQITVKLPCKPRIFMFWNAYCINSFVNGLGNGDFALTQNNFISSEDIQFYVDFGDECSFEQDDIKIIWSMSVPSPALPQLSSFPHNFPPNSNEPGNIYLNERALEQLTIADGGMPAEFALAGKKASPRKRRQVDDNLGQIENLGIMFPCSVKSFTLKDRGHGVPPIVGEKRRFLIDTTQLPLSTKSSKKVAYSMIDFDIDYGYDETGCVFDSSDVRLVVNPEPGWVDEPLTKNPKYKVPEKTLNCITCNDAVSNEECSKNGTVTTCNVGEFCATTVRQITSSKSLITKTCKQRTACENLEQQNRWGQCRPGKHGSVCRCCCYTEDCNADFLPCL